jgi:hypothetical protein
MFLFCLSCGDDQRLLCSRRCELPHSHRGRAAGLKIRAAKSFFLTADVRTDRVSDCSAARAHAQRQYTPRLLIRNTYRAPHLGNLGEVEGGCPAWAYRDNYAQTPTYVSTQQMLHRLNIPISSLFNPRCLESGTIGPPVDHCASMVRNDRLIGPLSPNLCRSQVQS